MMLTQVLKYDAYARIEFIDAMPEVLGVYLDVDFTTTIKRLRVHYPTAIMITLFDKDLETAYFDRLSDQEVTA